MPLFCYFVHTGNVKNGRPRRQQSANPLISRDLAHIHIVSLYQSRTYGFCEKLVLELDKSHHYDPYFVMCESEFWSEHLIHLFSVRLEKCRHFFNHFYLYPAFAGRLYPLCSFRINEKSATHKCINVKSRVWSHA